jgi:hypothetical protein
MAWITGVGMTAFGKHTGSTTISLMWGCLAGG